MREAVVRKRLAEVRPKTLVGVEPLDALPVDRAVPLDQTRALISFLDGRLFVFDGQTATPWAGPSGGILQGRIAALRNLADGNVDAAINVLERVSTKLPEALVNLGIAYERKGDPLKALDAWRRARKAGARFAPLNDWIESKERIYGGAQ